MATEHPQLVPIYKKNLGTIFIGKVPLAKFVPESPEWSEDAVQWNLPAVDQFKINRRSILASMGQALTSQLDNIQWSS